MWNGAVNGVLLEYTRTAGTVAETENGAVDVEVDIARRLQFIVVLGCLNVLDAVRQGTETERLAA